MEEDESNRRLILNCARCGKEIKGEYYHLKIPTISRDLDGMPVLLDKGDYCRYCYKSKNSASY